MFPQILPDRAIDNAVARAMHAHCARLDAQAAIFLRMGYEIDELTLLTNAFTTPWTQNVVPKSALEGRP